MKSIAFFSICFLSFSFSANAKKGPELKIVDATTQFVTSGMPVKGKPGYNEHYLIKLYVNTAKAIEFTNLWIGGKNVPFREMHFSSMPNSTVTMGDSLLLDYSQDLGEKETSQPVPAGYKGAAVIECRIAGKVHYFVVKQFRKLPDYSGE